MKSKRLLLVSFLFLIFSFANSYSDCIEKVGKDVFVNWTEGTITAKGYGYPSPYSEDLSQQEKKLQARQAAKTDAIRKLAEGIGNVRVDGVTVVKDLMKRDDVVRTKIKAFVKNCAEKKVVYYPDGKCEVVVVASLNGEGSLSHIVYDSLEVIDKTAKKKKTADVEKQTVSTEKPEKEEKIVSAEDKASPSVKKEKKIVKKEQEQKDIKTEEKPKKKKLLPSFVSGLIVNAKNTDAKPAINPMIISDTGERLYDLSVPDKEFRIKQGLATYTSKLQNAQKNKRVTRTPYVIEALKIVQQNPCIIMVSKKEFEEFKRMRGSDLVLKRARVIIVVGK